MRMLAIETATEACSVALFDGTEQIGTCHEVLGRGHAERLVPMIAALPDKGRAEQIRVSLGPGSFTGTRIGIAAARALGIAWQAQVVGFHTLQLVALQIAHSRDHSCQTSDILVCMNGGHGEWYVQPFDADCTPLGDAASMLPDDAVAAFDQQHVIGSRAREFVALRGSGEAVHALPDASFARFLDAGRLLAAVSPIYGRAPDARKPE